MEEAPHVSAHREQRVGYPVPHGHQGRPGNDLVGVGSHYRTLVDLVSAYSKRPELLVDLDHMLRQLEQVDNDSGSQSVQSTGRVGRVHGLQDRLTDADVRKIILSFEGGVAGTTFSAPT